MTDPTPPASTGQPTPKPSFSDRVKKVERELSGVSAGVVAVAEALSTSLPPGTARDVIQTALPGLIVVSRYLGGVQ